MEIFVLFAVTIIALKYSLGKVVNMILVICMFCCTLLDIRCGDILAFLVDLLKYYITSHSKQYSADLHVL